MVVSVKFYDREGLAEHESFLLVLAHALLSALEHTFSSVSLFSLVKYG